MMQLWLPAAALLGLHAARAVDGSRPSPACEAEDEAPLLQTLRRPARRQAKPSLPRPVRSGPLALALDGGGWSAFTVQLGVLVGLAIVDGKGSIAETLRTVDLISSVSGGSWFAAELIYSERFGRLLDQAVAHPSQAATLYAENWMAPYQNSLSMGKNVFEEAAQGLDNAFLKQAATVLGILQKALSKHGTWSSVVANLLETTADIMPDLTLKSANANSWAHGKIWLACNSLVVPSQKLPAWPFVSHPLGDNDYQYFWQSGGTEPGVEFIPTKISWRIGDKGSLSSPFPFVASGAMAHDTRLLWKGVDDPSPSLHGSDWTDLTAPLNFSTLQDGNLPVSFVAAASSAVLGGTIVSSSGDLPQALAELSVQLPVYAALNASSGKHAFTTAQSMLTSIYDKNYADEPTTRALAQSGMVALVDGAYTDNTAIGHAVAAGASQVVAIMQDTKSLLYLFSEESGTPHPFETLAAAKFGIFTFPEGELGGSTPSKHAQELLWSFTNLTSPSDKHLSLFQAGKLSVITRSNHYYGIEGGRDVSLILFIIAPAFGGLAGLGVPIVNSDDPDVFAAVVTSIVEAVTHPRNSEASNMILHALRKQA